MNITQKSINNLSIVAAETIFNAQSGHTGIALGAATIMYALFKDHYLYDVTDHDFFARDRFVLSSGHASALYYAAANLFNMGTSEKDLKQFRKLGSKTPGHPEYNVTSFVETSTGPLGQGVANAVGMAIGQNHFAERFNAQNFELFSNYTYCMCGDGCLMEGVATEAISLAGTLKLKNLILLYDSNEITIDGKLNLSNTENVAKKFKAMHWNVITVKNGNKYKSVTAAIAKAKRCHNKPTIIIFQTTIGYGTNVAGSNEIHGRPLKKGELENLKEAYGIEGDFKYLTEVKNHALITNQTNKQKIEKWNFKFVIYQKTHPDLYKQLLNFLEDKPVDALKLLKTEQVLENLSGRDANKLVLKELAQKLPRLLGGTADVASSSKAYMADFGDFSWENKRGRNIHFGVREHAMGAICNGITLYMNSPSFCSTFLAFSNYMLAPIRMSALMNLQVLYMFSHDSYKVGEDGPTHQSVEQLTQLRAIPNLQVFRPCDTTELLYSYDLALKYNGPSAFALSRQSLKNLSIPKRNADKGGYLLTANKKADILICASGSEVALALDVKNMLEADGLTTNVASFPCFEVFENQTSNYKNSVLSSGKFTVAIEASNDCIYYKYLSKPLVCNVQTFCKSGNEKDLDEYVGFTAEAIYKKIKNNLKTMNKK